MISAEKKSSQVIEVKFSANNYELAKNISDQVIIVISERIENLGNSQKERNWFKIIAEKPVIRKNEYNFGIILLASFLGGIFMAFWVVMLKHYFEFE